MSAPPRRRARRLLRALVGLIALSTAACRRDPEMTPAPSGWSHAGGDATRSASTSDPGPLGLPVIAWTQRVALDIASEPVSARLGEMDAVLMTSGDEVLALDLASGATLWRRDAGASMNASPLLAAGSAWAFTMDGRRLRLDPSTGAIVQETAHDFTLEASPLFVERHGLVVFEETSLSSGQAGGRLFAVDAATGIERWHADIERSAGRAASSDGTLLFVACHDGVKALRAKDGGVAWTFAFAGGPLVRVESPVVAGPLVLVAGGSMDPAQLVALSAVDGALRWQVSAAARLSAPPALAGQEILVPLLDGRIHRHAVEDGRALGTLAPGGRCDARPAVGATLIFVPVADSIVAFDRTSHALAWRIQVGLPNRDRARIEHLAIIGTSLLAVSLDGRIQVLREPPS